MASEAFYLATIVERQEQKIERLMRENEKLRHQLSGAINQDEEMLNSEAAAELLSMSAQGLRQLAREGEVPGARKVGSVWRFSKLALLTWER